MKNTTNIRVALYCNEHTGWNNGTVCDFFKQATESDLTALKAGDQIWIDTDPIHPNGKVYGYLCSDFVKFENGAVHYSSGFTTYLSKIFLLTDVKGFEEFVHQNPQATDI